MTRLLTALIAFSVTLLACVLFYRRGKHDGVKQALAQMASDLDETIAEWERRASAGDIARSLELPGLAALRRMLGR